MLGILAIIRKQDNHLLTGKAQVVPVRQSHEKLWTLEESPERMIVFASKTELLSTEGGVTIHLFDE